MTYRPVFYDTETTGLFKEDKIIELAAFDPSTNTSFSHLINPNMPIPEESIKGRCYGSPLIKDKVDFYRVFKSLQNILKKRLSVKGGPEVPPACGFYSVKIFQKFFSPNFYFQTIFCCPTDICSVFGLKIIPQYLRVGI